MSQHSPLATRDRHLPRAYGLRKASSVRWFVRSSTVGVLFAVLLAIVGCQQKMADQPSFKPLDSSTFFEDGRSARPTVSGTVARGRLRTDVALFTGRIQEAAVQLTSAPSPPANTPAPLAPQLPAATADNPGRAHDVIPGFENELNFVKEFPIPIRESVLQYGRERYMIYCVVCHDALGTGRGAIVERGYTPPPSFHIDRLRAAPVGRLFAVISEGYGSMPSYAAQIPPEDRWAVVAYLRALQLSQRFPRDAMTPAMRDGLSRASQPAPSAAPANLPSEGGKPQ
jgi:hypothetical protein